MRVTQSMLSQNMIRNLSTSYNRLEKLQNQLLTKKKITRPSDDPVVAMLGLSYRTDVNRIEQYQRNIGEVTNWLDTTDAALEEAVQVLQRIRELTVQAANGTYEENQRGFIGKEIEQLKEQLLLIGDTDIAGKYIFNGSKTNVRPNGTFATGDIEIEVFNGIRMKVNTDGRALFDDLFEDTGVLQRLINDLNNPAVPDDQLDDYIGEIQSVIDRFLAERANIGAKQNRVELMEDRLSKQEVFAKDVLSANEDVDVEKVIVELTTQESVHRAALAVGARIIQPTLVDFLN